MPSWFVSQLRLASDCSAGEKHFPTAAEKFSSPSDRMSLDDLENAYQNDLGERPPKKKKTDHESQPAGVSLHSRPPYSHNTYPLNVLSSTRMIRCPLVYLLYQFHFCPVPLRFVRLNGQEQATKLIPDKDSTSGSMSAMPAAQSEMRQEKTLLRSLPSQRCDL